MSDQLPLIPPVAPHCPEAATTPSRGRAPHVAHPAGRAPIATEASFSSGDHSERKTPEPLVADAIPIPPKPSDTARLRGQCDYCAQWPLVGETTGKLMGHKYPKYDLNARRGRCAGAGQYPARMKWSEPLR